MNLEQKGKNGIGMKSAKLLVQHCEEKQMVNQKTLSRYLSWSKEDSHSETWGQNRICKDIRETWACLNVEDGKKARIIGRVTLLRQKENLGFRGYFFSYNKDARGDEWILVFGGRKLMVLSSDDFYFLCDVEEETISWRFGEIMKHIF